MVKPVSTFRLDEQTLERLDVLSQVLEVKRPEVITKAVAAFANLIGAAYQEAQATLRELLERYDPNAFLNVFLEEDTNGEPKVSFRIDAEPGELTDFAVAAIVGPKKGEVLILLYGKHADDSAEKRALELKLAIGQLTGVVPGLCVGTLPWPPQPGRAIAHRIGKLAGLTTETAAKLELVEA